MLVQALTDYARTYLQAELEDEAFEHNRPVPYSLQVLEDGTFAGVRPREREVPARGGTRLIPESLVVPKSPVPRNTGLHPLLGCDAIQYVLGPRPGAWTSSAKVANHTERHMAFVDLLRLAAAETNDSALHACVRFYDRPEQVEAARDDLAKRNPREGAVVTLAVVSRDATAEEPGGPVTERPAVREYWAHHYRAVFSERVEQGGEGMCLICGTIGPVAPTHDKIKGVAKLGGRAEVSLMSFDKHAFRSYGWDQNANSPVSPDCALAYVLALNDLLRLGDHRRGASRDTAIRTRFDCAGVGFLFWTRKPSDDDIYALFCEAQPDQVSRLLSAPLTGRPVELEPNDFCLVAVSGNGGRLLVRYWFRDTLANVRVELAQWFRDLSIADVFQKGEPSGHPKLWQLLAAMSPPRVGADHPSNTARSVQLVRRAMHGLPLGRTILAGALGRLRAEKGTARLNPHRVGLVRMCVNDISRSEGKGGPTVSAELDPALDHPAYLCGRLLAVYDRLQYAAQGEVNVTVADRYYGMASTYPQLAFPRLERLSKAHFRKLRRDKPGAAVNIEREIRDLMSRLSGTFPRALGLEDQGRFVIGFHHQKAEDARRMAEARAGRVAAVPTPEV